MVKKKLPEIEIEIKKTKAEIKGLSNYPRNRENPFIDEVITTVQENTVSRKQFVKGDKGVENLIVNQDGEVTGVSTFMRIIEVDEEKFAKIYLSQFSAFYDLPSSGIKVFGYIMGSMRPNSDEVLFFLDECMKHTGYSGKSTIFQGIASLIEAGIIARGYNENVYFINPLIVFSGSRVTFAKTFIRKKKEQSLNNPNQMSLLDQPGV